MTTTADIQAAAIGNYRNVFEKTVEHHELRAEPGPTSDFETVTRTVLQDLTRFDALEQEILKNDALSETGQKLQQNELIEKAMTESLNQLVNVAERLDGQYSESEKRLMELPESTAGSNEVVAHLREAEIRAQLLTLSTPERMAAYGRAVQEGNADVIRAVRRAAMPIIDKEYQQRVDRESLELTKPQPWRYLQAIDNDRSVLRSLANTALGAFKSSGVLPDFSQLPAGQAIAKWGTWYDHMRWWNQQRGR